jgi:hypothetical protein
VNELSYFEGQDGISLYFDTSALLPISAIHIEITQFDRYSRFISLDAVSKFDHTNLLNVHRALNLGFSKSGYESCHPVLKSTKSLVHYMIEYRR